MPYRRTLSLFSILLACLLIFTGCKDTFSENPVVQNMKQGTQRVNLSFDDINKLMDDFEQSTNNTEPAPSYIPEPDFSVFDAFILKILHSAAIQYESATIHSENIEKNETQLSLDFLDSDPVVVTETFNNFVITDLDFTKRILHSENQTYLIDLEKQESEDFQLEESELNNLLLILANQNLVAIETSYQSINSEDYITFLISENQETARWYFDEQGHLFLRIFSDDDQTTAVKYDNIDFEPELEDHLFELEGSITEERSESEESSELEESENETSSKIEESASAESSLPESSIPEKSTESQSETTKDSSKEPSENTTSSQEPSPRPEVKTEPSKPSKEDGVPVPENYPSNHIPLIYGYELTSTSDDIVNNKRVISLNGTLGSTLAATTSYYSDVLGSATNYRVREMYDENSGYTYVILRGTVEGWNTSIEIAESHVTNKLTMSLTVTR